MSELEKFLTDLGEKPYAAQKIDEYNVVVYGSSGDVVVFAGIREWQPLVDGAGRVK